VEPLVSIVVPVYNQGHYLDEAVQSLLAQTYPNIEIIVLDDGSTDATPDVLKKYTGRLYWESQPNMGQSFTLNKGWQMAKGELLSYLSGDDVLMPQAMAMSVEYLGHNPGAVLTYGDFNLIDPNSRAIRMVTTPDFDFRRMITDVICLPGPGPLFRRSAFEKAGLWNAQYRQMPDYDYWLRLGLQGDFVRIPQVLAKFRVHEESQTFAQTSEDRAEEPVRIIQGFFENPAVPDDLRRLRSQALSRAYLVSAQLHVRSGRYRIGLRNIRQAFRLSPGALVRSGSMRMMANAFVNRVGHRLLWNLKRLGGRW
jgi:glycosyltransferase involved in cell wall biosynthesis